MPKKYTEQELSTMSEARRNALRRRRMYYEMSKIENELFILKMKDRWTREDWQYQYRLESKIKMYRQEIGRLGSSRFNKDGTNRVTKAQQARYDLYNQRCRERDALIESNRQCLLSGDDVLRRMNMERLRELERLGVRC